MSIFLGILFGLFLSTVFVSIVNRLAGGKNYKVKIYDSGKAYDVYDRERYDHNVILKVRRPMGLVLRPDYVNVKEFEGDNADVLMKNAREYADKWVEKDMKDRYQRKSVTYIISTKTGDAQDFKEN